MSIEVDRLDYRLRYDVYARLRARVVRGRIV